MTDYAGETFKDFLFEMFCYQWPKTAFTMFILWIAYLISGVECIVDVGWTICHWIIGLTLVLQYPSRQSSRTYIQLALLTAWFLRTGGFLFITRVLTNYHDQRYINLAKDWSSKGLFFFLQYQFQAFLILFTAMPLYFTFRNGERKWTWNFWVSLVLIVIGITGEAIADHQLYAFKQRRKKVEDDGNDQDQDSHLMKRVDGFDNLYRGGLWAKSRHPNLFFDLLTWTGFAFAGLNDYSISFLGFLGPITLWAIEYFVTIPITEEHMANTRQNWNSYVAQTNLLIPF